MEFYVEIQCINDFILDNSPVVDKWINKYDYLLVNNCLDLGTY